MEEGAKVWASGGEHLWQSGTVKKKTAIGDSFDIEVSLDVGGKQIYTVSGRDEDDSKHLKLRNVAGQSSVIEGPNVADLTSLTYLHEPAILHSLKERYGRNTIYTYTGPILLAVNPFKAVDLYTDKLLKAYKVIDHYNRDTIGLPVATAFDKYACLPNCVGAHLLRFNFFTFVLLFHT